MAQGFDEAWLATLPQRGGSRILEDSGAPPLAPQTPEKTLLGMIRQVATRSGFLCYHTHRSTKSEPGFPDLVLTKPGRLIFAEIKSASGKLTQAQQTWLAFLARSVPEVEVYLWSPKDWTAIQAVLQRRPEKGEAPHV